jgi:hypothetical protein
MNFFFYYRLAAKRIATKKEIFLLEIMLTPTSLTKQIQL